MNATSPALNTLWPAVERLLPEVQAPSQYLGTERNTVHKDLDAMAVTVALAFPDAYTIGMSHLGLQIFYGMLNALPDVAAERVYAPWTDMEAEMRRENVPLFSLESHAPVRRFDILGFSLQDEMCYTNVLNLLDLARIPQRTEERGPGDPLVIAGGPVAVAPEPVAEYIDLFVLGDGEDALKSIVDLVRDAKKSGGLPRDRAAFLRAIVSKVPGTYAPSLYDVTYHPDGTVQAVTPRFPDVPARVAKVVVPSFEDCYYPTKPVVPFAETVHDRINLEIMRGCPHACRFCQAVVIKNTLRVRSVERLVKYAEEAYENTGYDEIALTSLSSGDYPHVEELMARLSARFKHRRVGLSLPSLWISQRIKSFPSVIGAVRKAGFTFAPEAGSDRLRQVIKKHIKNKDLLEVAHTVYREGWSHVKLYFMVGLPTETMEDVDEIIGLAKQVALEGKAAMGRLGAVNASISPFVPKPHTPFQWEGMATWDHFKAVQERLRAKSRGLPIRLKINTPERNYVEGVMSRGDRRVGKAVFEAWKRGSRFEAWDEHFSLPRWMESFAAAGIDPDRYARRVIPPEETLPWDHLDAGLPKWVLRKDDDRAHEFDAQSKAAPAAAVTTAPAALPTHGAS
jgi:radical SAM family uncharacterized protein